MLEALLDRYAEGGISFLDMAMSGKDLRSLFSIPQFAKFGRPIEIVNEFGGADGFFAAVKTLQEEIYKD